MPRLNIFVYIECDLVRFHNTKCKNSTTLLKILHMSMKYGILSLDYEKR